MIVSITKGIMKSAAESIRTLLDERDELVKQAEIVDLSSDIIGTMVDKEMLTAEEVLPKLAELKERSRDDLLVLQKALELGTVNNMSKLGELSDQSTVDGLDPRERFVQRIIGDVL